MDKPDFAFGDLVRVNGYWPRVFKVLGYREEHYYYPDEQWTELVYELSDAITAEWLEADEEDLSLVASTEDADEYLAVNPHQYEAPSLIMPDWASMFLFGGETVSKQKEPRKPTARELSAKVAEERKKARKAHVDKIDRLLDELNDYRRLAAQFDDEEYKARVEFIRLKLTELTR
jgi:hypothetical protein